MGSCTKEDDRNGPGPGRDAVGDGQRGGDRRPLERGKHLSALRKVYRPGQPHRPRDHGTLQPRPLSGVLPGVRRSAQLGSVLAHHAGHHRRAVLEVVRGRQAQRVLQLRGPASRAVQEQGRVHLRPGAGGRPARGRHLSRPVHPGKRDGRAAARLRRASGGGPGNTAPADDPGTADHDAGVRTAGRRPLGGLRRLQRRGVRHPRRRLRQPGPDHHGRLLPERQAAGPQGERRHRRGRGREGRPDGGQGPGLETLPGQVGHSHPDGQGPRLPDERPPAEIQRAARRARFHGRGGAALPYVHERDDGPAEGMPAQNGRLPGLRGGDLEVHPGHSPDGRLLVLRRHRVDHGPLLYRVRTAGPGRDRRPLRGGADVPGRRPALADRPAPRREHLSHLADHDPHAAQTRAGRTQEIRVPLQGHDDRGGAHRARDLEMVLHRRRQGRGGHHRYLVADGKRRVPLQHEAGARSHEARQRRPGHARDPPGDLR